MSTPQVWRESPAGALEAAFGHIAATRMADLPICNPALTVAAVDFALWEGEWLGILVTPWTISLMLLPGGGGSFRPIAVGESQEWQLPSGEYTFMGSCEPGLGHFQFCSLCSPPADLTSQEEALAFARIAREAVLKAPEAERPAAPVAAPQPAPQAMSRRAFLRLGGRGPAA